ncbi:hypothetical protein PsorP6_008263 [Peronosclerospora sorghi]|uniref:Uncharacterized protein n=1 Tax=Peronosclerospora sorghi TaxID=230839 RepID=A0ACC0WBQ1_9STRA|nr:hypothetical protein PsorP6_008263 [Peronosclerospora sorghi]
MRLFRRKKAQDIGNIKPNEKGNDTSVIPPPLLTLLDSVQGMDMKPPVTLALIGLMYLLHIQVTRVPSLLESFALCPEQVGTKTSIGALFIAPFIHQDDLHLYQSLLSFLWKGYKLETRLGSIGFMVLLIYIITLSQALILLGAYLISGGALQECFTGFSGVLTAMKPILTVHSPTFTQLYNFELPTKYAAWLEMVLTYLFVPKLPLLAQAAGIVTGYIYILIPNADALVSSVSRKIKQSLIRVGLIKRPLQRWQLWSKLIQSIRQNKQQRSARKL